MAEESHVSYGQKTKSLVKLIEQAAYRHSVWQVFSDFLEMSAISISNSIDPVHWEDRERRYMEIVKGYNKAEINLFPQMLAELVKSLEQCAQEKSLDDILGKTFHELELHNKYKGQFFTPYDISRFMAEIQFAGGNEKEELGQNGYISVNDPACGAGAMLVAFANAAKRNGFNYQKQVLFVAQDIDHTAAMMCYIQLSLLGVAAYIKIGNNFTEPIDPNDTTDNYWFTPIYFSDVWVTRRLVHKMDDLLKGEK